MSVEILEPTKLRAVSAYHRFQSLAATTINATASSSGINSSCGNYSSGSSSSNVNVNNNSNLNANISSSKDNNSICSNLNSKFIDIGKFISTYLNKSVILDCRVLKEFENKHIQNSVHINCRDKITKKRLSTKKLSVKDIIGCEETKSKIESCCGLHPVTEALAPTTTAAAAAPSQDSDNLIVLYDDSTNDDNDLFLDQNPLQIVLDNIKHTFRNNNCKILKGGFKEFAKCFPQYCVEKEKSAICQPINAAYYANCEESFKYAIDNAKLTKILDHLYLGNECDAKNEERLRKEGITYVINVTKNIPNYHENSDFKYKRIAVNDACNQNLRQFFDETNKFIDEALENNTKVLVHCQAGISRSPTIVIAYLMNKKNISMNDAYNLVKDQRPIIGPNIIFLSQLNEYEKCVNISVESEQQSNNKKSNTSNNTVETCMTASIKGNNNNKSIFSFNNNNNTTTITANNAAANIGQMPFGFLTQMPLV